MKKLKALLVDDEAQALDGLTELLRTFCPEVEVTGRAQTLSQALDMIVSLSLDILFLDVHMHEGNGFDLVEVAKARNCSLVFVSGHRDYAVNAFRVDAVDYLLKPVDFRELQAAVARVILRKEKVNANIGQADYRVRIAASTGIRFISCSDIVGIEAEGRYSMIHTTNGEKQLVSRNIGEFETELDPHGFFRVHKSWLINCMHVTRMLTVDGGTIELTNGKKVLLSRRKKVEFLKRMEH